MIPDALRSIRTLINVWTNCTPHELSFQYQIDTTFLVGFLPQSQCCWKSIFKVTNKNNQKLINIFENQKVYGGFLKILIFQVSYSGTHLQSKFFLILYTRLWILKTKIKTIPIGKSLFKLHKKRPLYSYSFNIIELEQILIWRN